MRASAPLRGNAWNVSTDSQPDEGSEVEGSCLLWSTPAGLSQGRVLDLEDPACIQPSRASLAPRRFGFPCFGTGGFADDARVSS
jgi:hypothetical protein